MSSLISCHELSVSYEDRILFEDVSFHLNEGNRIGIIGANGTGKSTFLRIVAGEIDADTGTRSQKKWIRFSHIPQDPVFAEEKSIQDIVISFIAEQDNHDPKTESEQIVMANRALDQVGFKDFTVKAGTLSGGWKKRLAIAMALSVDPNVLLLDEPTNHMDLAGIALLESILTSGNLTFVCISHDRQFLENIAQEIIELDRRYPGGMLRTKGTYTDFLEKRSDFLEHRAKTKASLGNKVRHEIEWLRRGPKARTGKSNSRIKEANRLIDELSKYKSQEPGQQTDISFTSSGRKTKRLLLVENLCKTFGDKLLFNNLDLLLCPGHKIGLVGANGSGKTTLINLLSGKCARDSGTIEMAPNLEMVAFDQMRSNLNMNVTLQRNWVEKGDSILLNDHQMHVVAFAERFGFRREQLDMPLSSLSGGEQAKVLIGKLMLSQADMLLMDEPTNDLDIQSLEALEETLISFKGSLVLVTHDRYLMDRVCTLILGLDGKGNATFYADYRQWQDDMRRLEQKEKKPKTPKNPRPEAKKRPKGLSYLEKKEIETIEERILEAEEQLSNFEVAVQDPSIANDADKLGGAYETCEAQKKSVETLYARWEELEAKQQGKTK